MIRTEIWLYAIIPATVYTRPTGRKYQERPRKQENLVLLRVCHESRIIALERYESVPDIDKTYVNFDLDTVYIDFDGSFTIRDDPFCSSENEARFQYLAVDIDWADVFGEALVEKVSRCQSLRQLTLVFGFTRAIDREYEANLSKYLAKYKDMTKDEIADILGDEDDFPSFDALCEATSADWQLIALENFPDDLYALGGWKCKGQAARASFEEKS